MDPSSASTLIANSSSPVVANINGVEYKVAAIKDDPATLWLRVWNQGCAADDRLYLKVGTATPKEVQHVRHARQAWVGRFALFTVPERDVSLAFSTRPKGKTVFFKVSNEVR